MLVCALGPVLYDVTVYVEARQEIPMALPDEYLASLEEPQNGS